MTDSVLFQGPINEANAAAQAQEDENRLAGNPPNALEVDPAGQLPNPEGYTPVGEGVMVTPIEEAPGGHVPALEVTTALPTVDEVGGLEVLGGGGADALLATAAGLAPPPGAAEAFVGSTGAGVVGLPQPEPLTPTEFPTEAPTEMPTETPTESPTEAPPTEAPTEAPTESPTAPPTDPPTDPPTQPPTEGRWKIDQTPQAGDKTGGDEIWENPERGQKGGTLFDVSFNQGSFKLEEGQRIQVFLDVHDQHDDAVVTTAEPQDWAFAVTSKDPGLDVVASALVDGQLVVTLEAVRDEVNLTGDVFRVEVKALADAITEDTPELLVFDINDDVPALDLATQRVIGSDWDAHDDLVITIAENAENTPADPGPGRADLGAVVEAFEAEIEAHPPEALVDADLGLELLLSQELNLPDDQALEALADGGGDDSGLADAAFEPQDSVDEVLLMDLPLDAVFHAGEGADNGRG